MSLEHLPVEWRAPNLDLLLPLQRDRTLEKTLFFRQGFVLRSPNGQYPGIDAPCCRSFIEIAQSRK